MTKILLTEDGESERMPDEVIDEWKVVLAHPHAKTAIVLVDYDKETDTWMGEIAVLYEGEKDGLLEAVKANDDHSLSGMPLEGVIKIAEEEEAKEQP